MEFKLNNFVENLQVSFRTPSLHWFDARLSTSQNTTTVLRYRYHFEVK